MTKLAPKQIGGLIMGVFFLSNSIGNYIGGRMASLSDTMPQAKLFGIAGASAIVLAVILALFNGPMKRLSGDEE
jgi:POT family proton-dependent oligopeptide transporter